MLPYKNLPKVIKEPEGLKKRVPVRVTELTISDAHKLLLQEYENTKISKGTFENNVKHKAKRRCLLTCMLLSIPCQCNSLFKKSIKFYKQK